MRAELGDLVTSEGTIYPLLARLRRDGLVETTWRESESGPPRRYYRLTDSGRRALNAFVVDWERFRDSVDAVLPPRLGLREYAVLLLLPFGVFAFVIAPLVSMAVLAKRAAPNRA